MKTLDVNNRFPTNYGSKQTADYEPAHDILDNFEFYFITRGIILPISKNLLVY